MRIKDMRNKKEELFFLDKKIGENIRKFRLQKRIPQKTLGDVLGVSGQQIQKYETGQNSIKVCYLVHLAEFFQKNIKKFYI